MYPPLELSQALLETIHQQVQEACTPADRAMLSASPNRELTMKTEDRIQLILALCDLLDALVIHLEAGSQR